jgi:hypothetical protein
LTDAPRKLARSGIGGEAGHDRSLLAVACGYWVLVVMDQFTRSIVGFGVHRGVVLWRMFNRATRG